MNKEFIKIYPLILFLIITSQLQAYKVGLCIVATGKYICFVPPLIESARKHFCTNHQVTYFVFTDGQITPAFDIVALPAQRLGWPYDTMMRCVYYNNYSELLAKMDYVFATDADMRFVDTVGDEILGERVATMHPGFLHQRGSYENRSISTACVKANEGKYYFAGGFHGGSASEFINLTRTMANNIDVDLKKGIIAVWHDESHLNRYFIDNPPSVILSPSYCYPENGIEGIVVNAHPRLLALDKNHAQMRE